MSSSLLSDLRRLSRSAGFRLALWYSGFFIAGCVFFFGLAYFQLSASLAKRDREAVVSKFWDLAGEYQDSGLDGLERAVALQGKQRKTRPFFIQYMGPKDATPSRFLPEEWTEFDLATLENMGPGKEEHWLALGSRHDDDALEVLSLRLADGLLLQVGRTTDARQEVLAGFRVIVIWSLLAAVLISVPGGFLLASRAMRPVRDLISTIKKIEAGALGARVPERGSDDEFDELGRIFNRMLSRVETLIAGMKNALDNVAHDLRTPMTRLRAGAEQALTSTVTLDESRDALADCIEEADRVSGMIETLMDISEAETGIMKLHLESVDLAAVVDESVELYRYSAEEKGVKIEASSSGALPVSADRNRLRQVVANLLDNAVKYTPRGGRIALRAFRKDGQAVLTVSDTGAGIPAEEIAKVWDRLYRGDASRSQRGLGLGLSLVKAVVRAHRGTVAVENAPGGGARFSLTLPEGNIAAL